MQSSHQLGAPGLEVEGDGHLEGRDTRDQRSAFVEQVASERRERQMAKAHVELVITIQAIARGRFARKRFAESVRRDFDALFGEFVDLDMERGLPENKRVLTIGALFIRNASFPDDIQRFSELSRCLILSMSSVDVHLSFASLFLSKAHLQSANRFLVLSLSKIPIAMNVLQIDKVADGKVISLLVHLLVVFSSCSSWALVRENAQICSVLNQMCSKAVVSALSNNERYGSLATVLGKQVSSGRLALSSGVLNSLFSVLFKIVKYSNFSTVEVNRFVQYCLTCPALLVHLSTASVELLVKNDVFARALTQIASNGNVLQPLTGNQSLFLLANLVHLSYIDQKGLVESLIEWTNVMNKVLMKCDEFIVKKKGTRSHWHPIFGWYCEPLSHSTEGSLKLVSQQLQYLWSKTVVTCLFAKVLHSSDAERAPPPPLPPLPAVVNPSPSSQIDLTASIQKLWKKLNSTRAETQNNSASKQLPALSMTAVVCQLYHNAILTLTNCHTDILAGLCREDYLLPQLWEHIVSLSPSDNGLSYLLNLLALHHPTISHFAPLILFAECATSVISILDEEEMYEKGVPFSVDQLCAIAKFCNHFCFRAVWNAYIDAQHANSSPLFSSLYQLCMLLYNRDCRRCFTKDPKFWIVPDVKSSQIMSEFERKTERAVFLISRMSHLVVLHERIVLFRKYVAAEKEGFEGAPSTMITIERSRLLEDGYRQLSLLSTSALKATIRVKFINQQGLDEAGIDQDGVFKEFLELTLKQVFHPDLNLFKSSESRQLFPSPTSGLHENHLALFQFVGRMLAKAVYEGIVTEVHLAPVLLATVLNRRLCAFDELSQLDPELYKSLTYVKHYADSPDVADLSLNFSIDEDELGYVHTVDLVPGGRTIQVTNENKIAYVHKMAQYRVFNQTKEQCRHFVSGFLSVLSANWLALFAPHELQYLISGQSADVDLRDLRKHVQYYGGFHSNHRLIKWLWQILESDFDVEERHLFLKFVTSCSRAPLLGFAYLEPPFSIRCVEVSDDQDQGDTLASVVRGFLAIKRRQPTSRLPTASTCFNLLKLPNYSKKSVLLQKLRYAIHSETGFELS